MCDFQEQLATVKDLVVAFLSLNIESNLNATSYNEKYLQSVEVELARPQTR